MQFRIADTFTDSLAKLSGDEQKAVKTTAFDLQMNPANPGMQFHKLEKSKDKSFWSVRVSSDIRLIVHKTDMSLLICYVDHHDAAYRWAERRKLETHPKTGAAQFVEIRERIKEITIPTYVEAEKPQLFAHMAREALLEYGVPEEWLDDVLRATEDSILDLADHLPAEAGEALLELAVGGMPQIAAVATGVVDPFSHPDAQRRFRVAANVEELEQALAYPWEKWTVFLHPAQRELVERTYNGPARVSGSAGTGKTIVALHRAVYLARSNPDARILLTTFSETLARALQTKLRYLAGSAPGVLERIEVHGMRDVALRLYSATLGEAVMADDAAVREMLSTTSKDVGDHRFSDAFIWTEWREVVDAWQLDSWDAYRDVARLGRKTRLAEKQRQLLWSIFERVRTELGKRELLTEPSLFARLTATLIENERRPYEYAIIDEAQDVSVPQLRFLAALGASGPDGLFFAGDLGQRIFQPPFSWKALGVDIRGRSRSLRINYRTSHQIRRKADRLLGPEVSDVDGNTEDRRGTVSVFNGPEPLVQVSENREEEGRAVAEWLSLLVEEGFQSHEIGLFVRSPAQIDRAKQATGVAGLEFVELDDDVETRSGHISICTMHLAKGLEFRAVVVMACDDEVVPLLERIEQVTDDNDLEEVYNTERHLLYVACTRARDRLLVTGVEPASEFLDDMAGDGGVVH
jgi:mRNA-degrading endonuclease RelE of RelBE toxin-antitoxin system